MQPREAGNASVGAALVVGGGIGGMQAALDLAASGIKVYLVEKGPSVGGKMSQLDKTFPTLDCAMCTMAPRLVDLGGHKDIEILTLSEVESIDGEVGRFSVTVKRRPRYVDTTRCTGCGACVANCPTRNLLQLTDGRPTELAPRYRGIVDEILTRFGQVDAPLMPILQEINSAFNYFPESVLRYVADKTGHPLTHLYRVATFYSSFSITPRGKHVINVCLGTACYVRGSGRVMEKVSESLGVEAGETTPDMSFTLKTVRCIGCCGLAPAMMVGDEVFGKVTASRTPAILSQYSEM
jgi:NADH:ubiquinone oxidoreductase subunit E